MLFHIIFVGKATHSYYMPLYLAIAFVCLCCCFTSQVNSYGHGGTVSSTNHTFSLASFKQAVNQYFMQILSLVTYNNPSWMIQRKGGERPNHCMFVVTLYVWIFSCKSHNGGNKDKETLFFKASKFVKYLFSHFWIITFCYFLTTFF